MRVVAHAAEWDLAVLQVEQDRPEAAAWVRPASPSPVVVALGAGSVEGCEAVGFPDEEVQQPNGAGPGEVVRQSEQLRGTLMPKGQAKPPVALRPGSPREWMPLDASTTAPGEQAGWRGMSGAGVVLPDGRLAGVVAAAESAHQERRLYVVPLAPALTKAPDLTAALATVAGARVVVEAQLAPAYRRVLYSKSLRADGTPQQLGEIADLGAFGVKPVDLADELTYLNYVPRDDDAELTRALREAVAAKRVLLLVGDSGSGKSRSAAQATRDAFAAHRLVRPVEHLLPQLPDLPFADLGPAVVWLDDVEKYAHTALREILERLLADGAAVVGTIRRKELQALTLTGEIRNPSGEALADNRLVQRLDWKREWSPAERDRTAQHVSNPLARAAVATGLPLGVWAVAGPQLVNQLALARSDEDYPCRFQLVRAVLDWYRTGLTIPTPRPVALGLINAAYLGQPASEDEITDAIEWCTHPIDIGGRRARYSLLTGQPDQSLAINDYVQDHDRRHDPPPIPDTTWSASIANAPDAESIWGVGTSAYQAGHTATAQTAMRVVAAAGHTDAMYNLGLLLEDQNPAEAQQWYEQAANAGHIGAMSNLGVLWIDQNPAEAQRCYEQAANAGHTDAMYNLGLLLKDRDPAEAQHLYEQAANAGHTESMVKLGVLLKDRDPAEARLWWERAARAGHIGAMNNLCVLLKDRDPAEVRHWHEQAAKAGHIGAMNNLGVLLKDQDPAEARHWWERAAAGDTDAIENLRKMTE